MIPNSAVKLLRKESIDENDLLGEATESMKIVEEFIAEDAIAKKSEKNAEPSQVESSDQNVHIEEELIIED